MCVCVCVENNNMTAIRPSHVCSGLHTGTTERDLLDSKPFNASDYKKKKKNLKSFYFGFCPTTTYCYSDIKTTLIHSVLINRCVIQCGINLYIISVWDVYIYI